MNEVDEEKHQIKKANDEKAYDLNTSKIHLKNAINFNKSEIASLE